MKIFPVLLLISLAGAITGCATRESGVAISMSDQDLCATLGPMSVNGPDERRELEAEAQKRGVICEEGKVTGYRNAPR